MSDEVQAWLSAYEAGTLREEERKQLFARALEDQALFDALMEAETMRAAMEGPLAKRALLQALEEAEVEVPLAAGATRAAAAVPVVMPMPMPVAKKAERRGGWWWMVGVAAVLVGSVGTYRYWQKPAEVMVAEAPKPVQPEVALPPAPLPQAAPVEAEQPRREVPRRVKREETPTLLEVPAAPVPAAAASANQVAEVAKSAELKDAVAPESRARMSVGGAQGKLAGNSLVRVAGGRVEVAAEASGQLYVFVEGPNGWTRVAGLAPQALLAGGARSFALPQGLRGNLAVLVAPQRDAELDGLAEPLAGTLPVRNWTRVRLP